MTVYTLLPPLLLRLLEVFLSSGHLLPHVGIAWQACKKTMSTELGNWTLCRIVVLCRSASCCVCVWVCVSAVTAYCISLGGEDNAHYPVLPSCVLLFSNLIHLTLFFRDEPVRQCIYGEAGALKKRVLSVVLKHIYDVCGFTRMELTFCLSFWAWRE